MKIAKKWLVIITTGVLIMLAVFLYFVESMFFHIRAGNVFSPVEFPESSYHLYDIGITDVNSDGVLDIFTSNHYSLQRVMLGDGSGHYIDSLASMHLNQDADYPGSEDWGNPPSMPNEGVYIYWYRNTINIRNHNVSAGSDVAGQLSLYSGVKINSISDSGGDAAHLEVQSEETLSGATITTIKFRLESGASLQLRPDIIAIPIMFSFEKSNKSGDLFIGQNHIVPDSHEFKIFLRDRHGMAWADFTGDGLLDLFIVRGGLKGNMLKQPDQDSFKDELLVNAGDYFVDITPNSGLRKNGCSGHQVAWVDFNNDDKLDIYISCRREGQANQLYMQADDSTFQDVAEQFNLDCQGKRDGAFLWLDFDKDQDQDLILEEDHKIWLYINEHDTFTRRLVTSHKGNILKLTAADYDWDGDQDIYAASSRESLLLINGGDSFSVGDLAGLGLPQSAETANWVDYDNDGLIDLHVVPGGIYKQQSNHMFKKTGLLEHIFRQYSVKDAIASWFDMDNDGDRDLVMAVKYKSSPVESLFGRMTPNSNYELESNIFLYKNHNDNNHWLQIRLIGPKGNPQALGARVIMENSNGDVTEQIVGHAEGSHSSQGHYRLYFGLGSHDKPKSLRVVWPDGKLQTVHPESDKLILVEYEQ